jgi:aminoglycoside phosphotransferase (APT) family kinase protein
MTEWEPSDPVVVEWIQDAIGRGARVMSVERMPPSSTDKHAVDVRRADGDIERLVLRRYHDAEQMASELWYDPSNESRALELLEATPVAAPKLYAKDLGGGICDAPALLESWVPGEQAWDPVDLDRYLTRSAEMLVAIHGVATPSAGDIPVYRPYFADDEIEHGLVPEWSAQRWIWEDVFERIHDHWPVTPVRFIHRDYHPGNALWDGERIGGVVDWATAARGPAGIDLARMRQNLATWHGKAVADRFTERYVEAGGDPAARHPFWDLLDAADSVADTDEPGAPGEGDVGLFEDYVASVAAEL